MIWKYRLTHLNPHFVLLRGLLLRYLSHLTRYFRHLADETGSLQTEWENFLNWTGWSPLKWSFDPGWTHCRLEMSYPVTRGCCSGCRTRNCY